MTSSFTGRINQIVVKVAERCNLNCSYCYLYQHEDTSYLRYPKFMNEKVFENLLIRVLNHCQRYEPGQMNLIFHGGEPSLVGVSRMRYFCERARTVLGDHLSNLCMQTNATLLDDEWIDVIRTHDIQVGVSLDGPAEIHDAARPDHAGQGSHAKVVRGLQRLQQVGLNPNILCVVNPGVDSVAIYDHFRELGCDRIDFLRPDVSHENKARFYGRFGRTPIADYLIPIFDRWFDEDNPNIKIRVFWNLITQILGGIPDSDAFGNPLVSYVVVETNGSIQPLDALRVCEDGIAESDLNVNDHDFDQLELGPPILRQMVQDGVALPAQCKNCKEVDICGGGYLPNRYSRARGFDNPSVWCQDTLDLIAHIRSRIAQ